MKNLFQIKKWLFLGVFLVLIAVSNKVNAGATNYTWTGSTSTEWNLASNWSSSTVPTSTTGAIIPATPTGGRWPLISSSSGSVACKDLTINSGAQLNMTGGTLNFYHDWKNSGSFNGSGGTVVFQASAGGGPTFAAGTNQFYNITVNSGVDPGFDNVASSSIYISGNFTNNNTALAETINATFTFNGSGTQTITGTSTGNTFGHLVVNKSGGTLSMANAIKIAGNFTMTAGTFDPGTYALTIAGTFTSFAGGTIRVGASTFAGNYTKNPTPSSGTYVDYYASGAQTVSNSFTYSNLILQGSGDKTSQLSES